MLDEQNRVSKEQQRDELCLIFMQEPLKQTKIELSKEDPQRIQTNRIPYEFDNIKKLFECQ